MAQQDTPSKDAANDAPADAGSGSTAEAAAPANVRRCLCGYTRGHHMVSATGQYTVSGYLRLFVGISARPTKVKYHCRRCDKVFDSTTDPAILDEHY